MTLDTTSGSAPMREMPNGQLYYSPQGLYDFQVDGIATCLLRTNSPDGVIAVWDTGVGKAAPVSEPVLTPEGWRTMGDIRPGDEVFGVDGHPAKVESIHPQTGREVYKVTFSDGSWTRCTAEHLWAVEYWGSDRSSGIQRRVRRTKVMTLAQLMGQGIKTPQGRRKFTIPITAPVQYPAVELPMDPYVLGVMLGDAWISSTGLVQICTDQEILEVIRPGHPIHERQGCWQLNSSSWRQPLTDLGLAGHRAWEKFVPEVYIRAPVDDRRALLAGLLDTDGSPIATGGVEFSTTSRELADAVIELTQSLGGVARDHGDRTTIYVHDGERREGRRSYRVNVKLPENPFRLARKAERWVAPSKYEVARHFESIERVEDEDTLCIKVDRWDGLYLTRHHIVTHNTHLAMGTAAYLFDDALIDLVMVIAEKNKIKEWEEDFTRFTALTPHRYHGSNRQLRLSKLFATGGAHVFITTYETGRNELLGYESTGSRGKGNRVDGPLVATLGLHEKRILWVFDEPTKLRKRRSENHRAYDHLLRTLRRGPHHQRALGLTATPLERDIEDAFNVGRIIAPSSMPTVARFDELFVADRDHLGRTRFKPGRQQVFASMFQQIVIRKKKTDADVLSQFPKQVEEAHHVTLNAEHARLYAAVESMCDPPAEGDDPRTLAQTEAQERQLFVMLRMIAGHPASVLRSNSDMAGAIVEAVGADRLRQIKSSKSEALLDKLQLLVRGQGAQVVIFTFFANTVLPELHAELTEAGYLVSVYRGGQSSTVQEQAKRDFKEGRTEILLASDAAARGINLENAQYAIEYDGALTYANRKQRLDRIHRISSNLPSVTCTTMVLDNTIEEGIINLMLSRNRQQDTLLGDEDDGTTFISAASRRELLSVHRDRRNKK
jgi:hypothetical protein